MLVDNKADKAGNVLNLSVFSGFIFISCVVYCPPWIKPDRMTVFGINGKFECWSFSVL